MLYMVTFTINIPQMLAYIPYMDPMGSDSMGFPWVQQIQFTGFTVGPMFERSACSLVR